MVLTKGTNCGFVTSSPSADPTDTASIIDTKSYGIKDSPSSSGNVTEIGWYCDNATQAADFQVGIYEHDAGSDVPGAAISIDTSGAKGTTAGWKKVTGLSIAVTSGTTYWICVQVDNTVTQTNMNLNLTSSGNRYSWMNSQTELADPWSSDGAQDNRIIGIYAKVEAAGGGTNMQTNIGDDWKSIAAMQINIGDAWKSVAGAQINIGDNWKTIF